MKKHLIALAVAGAVAAPAIAQNVTVYGDIDAGLVMTDGSTDKVTVSSRSISSGTLGIKATEDLGGGLKASLVLEADLDANGAVGKAANEDKKQDNTFFSDEAHVALSGAFGEVRIGYTDLTSGQALDGVSQANLGNILDANSTTEIGGEKAGVIRYISPDFNGIKVELGYAKEDSSSTTTAENGFVVSYSKGPLMVAVARSAQTTNNASEIRVAGSYDFGVAKVGFHTQKSASEASNSYTAATAATATANASGAKYAGDYKEFGLGVTVPMGSGIILGAGLMSVKSEAASDAGDLDQYAFGVTKDLSKRTTVYAAYRNTDFTAASATDEKATYVGVIHKF